MKDELDRESLLIYLNDLRTMETIIYESDGKVKQLKTSVSKLKTSYNIESGKDSEPKPPEEPCMPVKKKLSRESILPSIGGAVAVCACIYCFSVGMVFLGIIFIVMGIGMCYPMIKEFYENREDYYNAIATYLDQVENLESNRLKYERAHDLWEVRRKMQMKNIITVVKKFLIILRL